MSDQSLDELRFHVLRNALYHTARRRWLERWNRTFTFLTVLLGTAAAAQLLTEFGFDRWIGAAVAAVGALQLVFDFSGEARTHEGLQRRYYAILAEMEEAGDPTEHQLRRWRGEWMRITADEPPTFRALDSIAHNEASDALGYDKGDRLRVRFHEQVLAQFLAFTTTHFPTFKELSAPKA